ncbi:MAG: alpha/beta hydrolase, partial [Kineosporiaceae bacterium]
MLPYPAELVGRIDRHVVSSELLRGNPLGDPSERPLEVYVPPEYDGDPSRRYPSVYVLQGYTGMLPMWHNRTPFRPTFPEAVDQLFAAGETPPCLVVFVDAWTAYGGSQFVDSPGTGRYHSYLCDEVVAYVDKAYRTLARPEHRGVMGKSSGGFGAMITPMLRPDVFGALASHAGDSLYEACYVGEFAKAARALRDGYGGSYERFWEDFRSRPAMSKPDDGTLVILYGCAAASTTPRTSSSPL